MTISKGFAAEGAAAHELARKHYRILARNHHCTAGEIDIVARDGDTIVFCEVKQRAAGRENALLSVSHAKQRKLVAAALHYLSLHPELDGLFTRFDVLAVVPAGQLWRVHHVEDAFRPPDED